MMSEIVAVTPAAPIWRFGRGGVGRAMVAAMVLSALADWLFYDQDIGISVAVFIIAAGFAFFACLPNALDQGRMVRAFMALAAAALPWVADAE